MTNANIFNLAVIQLTQRERKRNITFNQVLKKAIEIRKKLDYLEKEKGVI